MISLCIYSHSDYFDILKIQMDYVLSLNIPYDIYLFVNIPFTMSGGKRKRSKSIKRRYRTRKRFNGGSMEKVKTILYDDKLPYYQRLVSCIEQVKSTHFIITHEDDILLKIDTDYINKVVDAMNTNNIDAIKLVNINSNPEIHIKDTLYIRPITEDDTMPYTVNPRIWRKESALKHYSKFPQKNYKSSENTNVQSFAITQKIYTLCDKSVIRSSFNHSPCYVVIHIIWGGQIRQYDKEQDKKDPMIMGEYTKIKEKYFKNTKRAFHEVM